MGINRVRIIDSQMDLFERLKNLMLENSGKPLTKSKSSEVQKSLEKLKKEMDKQDLQLMADGVGEEDYFTQQLYERNIETWEQYMEGLKGEGKVNVQTTIDLQPSTSVRQMEDIHTQVSEYKKWCQTFHNFTESLRQKEDVNKFDNDRLERLYNIILNRYEKLQCIAFSAELETIFEAVYNELNSVYKFVEEEKTIKNFKLIQNVETLLESTNGMLSDPDEKSRYVECKRRMDSAEEKVWFAEVQAEQKLESDMETLLESTNGMLRDPNEKSRYVERMRRMDSAEEKVCFAEVQAEQKLESDLETLLENEQVYWRNELDHRQMMADNELIKMQHEKQDVMVLLENNNNHDKKIQRYKEQLRHGIDNYIQLIDYYEDIPKQGVLSPKEGFRAQGIFSPRNIRRETKELVSFPLTQEIGEFGKLDIKPLGSRVRDKTKIIDTIHKKIVDFRKKKLSLSSIICQKNRQDVQPNA